MSEESKEEAQPHFITVSINDSGSISLNAGGTGMASHTALGMLRWAQVAIESGIRTHGNEEKGAA